MKLLLITLLSSILISGGNWETDFNKAKELAKAGNKFIILNFSGSDWCGPCIRLHKEILDKEVFLSYAGARLVLVNADFPRLKKNKLTEEQQQKNEQLAEIYNKEGKFPLTLLLNAEGKILKSWEGYPALSPESFTNEIKAIADAGR